MEISERSRACAINVGFPNSEIWLSVNATVVNHWFQEMM